jgi:hypothetical protein
MLTSNLGQSSFWSKKTPIGFISKNYKCLAIPYFLFPKYGFLSSSTQIWGNVCHDFLLDTKAVLMNGRDWDIIPKFTYPMQSNFEHFMCLWDRNPKFSRFEGMTLALQAHLFNRLYQTRGTKLKFDTHLLHPAPTGTINDYLIYKFITSVYDGARVHHRRPTGFGPALPEYGPGPPDSRISTDRACCAGCRVGSVIEGQPSPSRHPPRLWRSPA